LLVAFQLDLVAWIAASIRLDFNFPITDHFFQVLWRRSLDRWVAGKFAAAPLSKFSEIHRLQEASIKS
jgi:hypothetical protein